MERLKVLFTSPEVVPFAKTGGLADISGKLPEVIAQMGHEVKVIMPCYSTISPLLLRGSEDGPEIEVSGPEQSCRAGIVRVPSDGHSFETLLIDYPPYFDRAELYVDSDTGLGYDDNDDRFVFFCRAALETLRALDWKPDIIHANDWQSALIPTYLATLLKDQPFYAGIRTVFTIHNMGYQGIFPPETFAKLGLPEPLFAPLGPFEFWGKVNFMKSALHYADLISTVSERYAVEIQSSEEYGCGLEGVLRQRNHDLYGIVNGADYEVWSPMRDSLIPYRYNPANLSGKRKNKVELINRLGLPFREEALLIGMITRLVDQKGLDILVPLAQEIFALNLQLVILGTGEKEYHDLLDAWQKEYPDRFRVILGYDNNLAHWIEAGADAFLMPSRYEPCGLNQLYSLKYGTVPIVRATGGLADTVADVDPKTLEGTGFVFHEYESGELLDAIRRAVALFHKKRSWCKIMKSGMRQDYSWVRSSQKYIDLYRLALSKA